MASGWCAHTRDKGKGLGATVMGRGSPAEPCPLRPGRPCGTQGCPAACPQPAARSPLPCSTSPHPEHGAGPRLSPDHGLHGCHQALALTHGGQPKPGGHPGGPRWGSKATHLGHKLLVLLVQVGRGGHVVPPDPQLALLGEPGGGGETPGDTRAGVPSRDGATGHKAATFLFYPKGHQQVAEGCSKPQPARATAQ